MAALKFKEKIENTPDVYSFVFEKPMDFNWTAGQYFQMVLPHDNPDSRGIKRFFSISCAPFENIVMITTRIEAGNCSSFKMALLDIKKGTEVEFSAPRGKLTVNAVDKKLVFVAGGIGITPIRSILLDLAYSGRIREIDLMYSNRDENLPFKNDFEDMQKRAPGFNIYYFISPKRIDKDSIGLIYEKFPDCYAFISGPPVMVKSVEELFAAEGLTDKNIRTDYFPGY